MQLLCYFHATPLSTEHGEVNTDVTSVELHGKAGIGCERKSSGHCIECLLTSLISDLSGLSLPETSSRWMSDSLTKFLGQMSLLQLDCIPVYLRRVASVPVHSLDSSVTSYLAGVTTTFLTNFPAATGATPFDPDQCVLNTI